jgi:UDP-3-O-[3-hydroxymyristoyl] glucosamine N-acyltransferase
MEFTARQIAELLNGTIEGDPEVSISSLSKIDEGKPGTIAFLANPAYTHHIYDTSASIVIVNNDFAVTAPVSATLIRVENAYVSFAQLLEFYQGLQKLKRGISPLAFVSPGAKVAESAWVGEFTFIGDDAVIGENVQLHPQVYIGNNVKIGDGTMVYPGVRIYKDCIIGKECTFHSGAVIGADGFGFAPQSDNNYKKIPQVGNVVIEDNVEIGANTTIDRATLGSTIIRRGVKLDNLIQVAHNVEIGENTVIASQTGISGSTKIGKNCMFGGQVGFIGHITVADNVKIGAQSGIEASIKEEGVILLGSPAIDAGKAKRNYVHWRNLDDIVKKIYKLEKNLNK